MVPFGARYRGCADSLDREARLEKASDHADENRATHVLVTHDTAVIHILRRRLELRLHKREEAALGSEHVLHGWKDVRDARERDVAHCEVETPRVPFGGDVDDVRALEERHARVVTKRPVELGTADVDGKDMGGATGEQAVRKAARRAPHVHAFQTGNVERERVERALQLEAATARVAARILDMKFYTGPHLGARSGEALAARGHHTGHNGP